VREAAPKVLEPTLTGLLDVLREITTQIEDYDAKIEALADERYPQTRWLKQAPGVGTLTALTFVLTVGEPGRFAHSRDMGPFLGLVPRRRQSGEQDPHLRISKWRPVSAQTAGAMRARGDGPVRSGLRVAPVRSSMRGRAARRRSVRFAVARKLAVLLHRLWSRQEVFQPFPAAVAA